MQSLEHWRAATRWRKKTKAKRFNYFLNNAHPITCTLWNWSMIYYILASIACAKCETNRDKRFVLTSGQSFQFIVVSVKLILQHRCFSKVTVGIHVTRPIWKCYFSRFLSVERVVQMICVHQGTLFVFTHLQLQLSQKLCELAGLLLEFARV